MAAELRPEPTPEPALVGPPVDLGLLEAVLRQAPIPFAFHDAELRYRHVNDALGALNGRAPAEHFDRRPTELLDPDLAAHLEGALEQVLRSGEPLRTERAYGSGSPPRPLVRLVLVPGRGRRRHDPRRRGLLPGDHRIAAVGECPGREPQPEPTAARGRHPPGARAAGRGGPHDHGRHRAGGPRGRLHRRGSARRGRHPAPARALGLDPTAALGRDRAHRAHVGGAGPARGHAGLRRRSARLPRADPGRPHRRPARRDLREGLGDPAAALRPGTPSACSGWPFGPNASCNRGSGSSSRRWPASARWPSSGRGSTSASTRPS